MPCLPARKGSLSGFRAPQLDIVAVNRTNPRTLPAEVKAETKRLSGVSVPFLIRSAATGKRQQAEAAGPYDIEKQRNLTGEADLYEDLGQQLQEATNAGDVSFVNSVVTLVAQKASEE